MSEETKSPTTSDVVTEQDKGRCAPALGSETWWKTTPYGWDIGEAEVERHTDCNLFMKRWGDRVSKVAIRSSYESYWPTKESALGHLIKRAEMRLREAEREVVDMRELLSRLSPNTKVSEPPRKS